MKRNILMFAYTGYSFDTRVRREAETLVQNKNYIVTIYVPKENTNPRSYKKDGVNVVEYNFNKYQGKSKVKYLLSYLAFMLLSFFTCSKLLFLNKVKVVHFHNMRVRCMHVARERLFKDFCYPLRSVRVVGGKKASYRGIDSPTRNCRGFLHSG